MWRLWPRGYQTGEAKLGWPTRGDLLDAFLPLGFSPAKLAIESGEQRLLRQALSQSVQSLESAELVLA